MNKSNNNPRFVYPMSMLSSMLTDEQIEKFSENYEFSREDEFFHFDEEAEFLESLSAEDIETYNGNMPKDKILLMAV